MNKYELIGRRVVRWRKMTEEIIKETGDTAGDCTVRLDHVFRIMDKPLVVRRRDAYAKMEM